MQKVSFTLQLTRKREENNVNNCASSSNDCVYFVMNWPARHWTTPKKTSTIEKSRSFFMRRYGGRTHEPHTIRCIAQIVSRESPNGAAHCAVNCLCLHFIQFHSYRALHWWAHNVNGDHTTIWWCWRACSRLLITYRISARNSQNTKTHTKLQI